MTTTPTSGAADLASRLRNACTSVRSKSYPLDDLIPLMQQAADALASTPAQPVAEPADTVVLNAAMRAIQQAIELIGDPTDERMRAVRRVLRGAVIVAEDAGEVALRKASELERVLVDQLRAFADATYALRASHGQAPASVLHLVHSAFAEIAMAFPKAFALHKVGIADTAVREALAAPALGAVAGPTSMPPSAFLNAAGIKADDMPGTVVRKLDASFHEAVTFADAAPTPTAQAAESVTEPAGVEEGDIDAVALARYKVVHSHDSMFHRFAVVAGDGKQQLYLGRETECQNMTRKFACAFLDGAFYQSQIAAAPGPADGESNG